MEIRVKKGSDVIEMCMIAVRDPAWQENIANVAATDPTELELVLVAEENGRILGFIYGFRLPNGCLMVEFLYVCPENRKHGIGRQLLRAIEAESGCDMAILFYNQALRGFYQREGYDSGLNLEVAVKNFSKKS